MKTFLSAIVILFSSSSYALRTKLTADELSQLKKGDELTRVEELKDEPFPRVTLINIIPHTPSANMKVFSDFKNHKKFVPGLLKSDVVKVEGNATDVSFEMEMPIVKNTKYVTRNT